MATEQIDTVVVGGGQSGLSVGYHLAKRGMPFVILDGEARVGDAWRKRWDSLRLFTPARFDGLDGMRFPAPGGTFPTKDAMGDFLETYARRFQLPVRSKTRVSSLSMAGGRFVVETTDSRFEANNVVIAMSNYQQPRTPVFAKELERGIRQLHSLDYKSPSQLAEGDVLIVGAGNSAAEIAIETARTHATWMAGSEAGAVPFRIETPIARAVLIRLVRFVGHHILTVRTPLGRKARPSLLKKAAPLIRVKPKDLTAAGIQRVGRVAGVKDGRPLLDDGRALDVANVIWCTGFNPGFSWIDLPVFDEDGEPMHSRGIADTQPGLYFVGLRMLYAATSDTVTGMRRDARRVARHIIARARTGDRAKSPESMDA